MSSKKTFISYSHADTKFVIKLTEDLRTAGADFWLDQRDILPGDKWIEEIGKGLKESQIHLIILSKSAIESRHCMNESVASYVKNKPIIPLLIEECERPWWLENVQYIDFTDDYGSAFKKLLAAIDLETIPKPSIAIKELPEHNQKQIEDKEEYLWSKARQNNSILYYQKYLGETELGKHIEEAHQFIAKIKDDTKQKFKRQIEKDKGSQSKDYKQVKVLPTAEKGIIKKYFIRGNKKIKIISNGGKPSKIPKEWRPILSRCEMMVIIPNMHMYLYNSSLDNFKYGAKAMLDFLRHLDTLKEEMALKDQILRIYQLGDLYEQRFPGLQSANTTAVEIRMSHPDYDQIINMMNGMRTHFIYGNHDFELRHFPGVRFAALDGKVYLEHGFTPDSWKDFTNPNANLWEVGQFVFLTIREINEFFAYLLIDAKFIKKDAHYSLGVRSGKEPDYGYPSETEYIDKYRYSLDYFSERMKKNPENKETKITVIGHTHHPYINTNVNGGKHIYIDAGAWTDGRSDFVVITNQEAAICSYER